jgi:nucleotide-binding universal stress UspA family protein
MTGTTYGIVAGYDGSLGAEQAVRWAAREARFRGTTLTVCSRGPRITWSCLPDRR